MWGPQDLLMSPSCGHGGLVFSQLTHHSQTSVSPSCTLAVDNACRRLSCAAVLSMPGPLAVLRGWPGLPAIGVVWHLSPGCGCPTCTGC